MDAEKTPVTILQEMMIRLGKTPVYELSQNKLELNPPIFTYKVKCDESEATGSGKSKKEAKHNAANAMIKIIEKADVIPLSSSASSNSPMQMMKFFKACSSAAPSSDNFLDSSAQELIALCSKYKLEEPVFKELDAEGPPHARIYTVKCSISTISTNGTGKSKKQAKHNSAKVMIDCVKDMFNISDASNGIGNKKPKLSNADETKKNLNSKGNKKEVSNLKINYDLKMESERKELSKNLKKLLPNPLLKLEDLGTLIKECQKSINEENITKVKQEFQSLLQSVKIDFHHMLLQSISSETFMLIIQLNTNPDILEMSLGTSREEAELRTINKVVETLKVFLR